MELTKDDMQSLHMIFSVVDVEKIISENAKPWLKEFRERISKELQEEAYT